MQLREPDFGGLLPIDGYGPGFFRVAGVVHEGPVLLTGRACLRWGGLDDTAPLAGLAGQIDVLLIGMGATMAPLPPVLQALLEDSGLGADPMATPAAARGYNVLLAEGRRVAAALLPVGETA